MPEGLGGSSSVSSSRWVTSLIKERRILAGPRLAPLVGARENLPLVSAAEDDGDDAVGRGQVRPDGPDIFRDPQRNRLYPRQRMVVRQRDAAIAAICPKCALATWKVGRQLARSHERVWTAP